VQRDLAQCEACGVACPAPPLHASASCAPPPGGTAYACGFTCDAGWFTCGSACCRANAVAAGGDHSCAILSDTSLTCWGANDSGQVDPALAGTSTLRAVRVLASGVTDVSLGQRHTCAVQGTAVRCWGWNSEGQLGAGLPIGTVGGPVAVSGLAGVDATTVLAAGARHTCALVAGAVKCWGRNVEGQLGTGSVSARSATPVSSQVASGASLLSTHADTTCALVGSAVKCWGANGHGQVGTASPDPEPVPTNVPFPAGGAAPTFLAVGDRHACAGLTPTAQTNSGLFCWGDNAVGQLGSSSPATQSTPLQAGTIDNGQRSVRALAGGSFSCSAKDDLEFKCQGASDLGQAGPGGSATTAGTVSFSGLVDAAAGTDHACVLVQGTSGGPEVQCWGSNLHGQLGRATAPSGSSTTLAPAGP
jgi:alpha-tubulin suppressor-like RCC1 family protein